MVMIPCPVCNYLLSELPEDYDYCPCCGTQFGYHDAGRTYASLRQAWVSRGMPWWSPVRQAPDGWNAQRQLLKSPPPDNTLSYRLTRGLLTTRKPANSSQIQSLRFSVQIPRRA